MVHYADGIKNITIYNGVVNFELLITKLDENNLPVLETSGHLAMSLNGFINLHDQVSSLVKKMIDEGILKPSENQSVIEESKNV